MNAKLKPGYKQTEVGVIPEDWEVSALRNCCIKITDGTHDTPRPVQSGIPFLTAINVRDNWIDYESCLYLAEADHIVIFRRCNPEKNDVLMVNIGAGVATTALVKVDYEFSLKNVALLKPDSRRAMGAYLNYSLAQRKPRITQDLSSGGAQPFLSLTQIGEILIPLPPTKAEQETIAEALGDADALIESLEQLIAKKRHLKQGAMQELLTGKKRLPGFSGKWEVRRFIEVCWFQEGPGVMSRQFTASGVKLLNGTNISRGILNLHSTSRSISVREAYGAYAHFLADVGDIVIASSGISIERFDEKVAFVRESDLPFCMNTSTIRFKPFTEVLDSAFLYQFLTSDSFKQMIGGQATGSAQLNFGPTHVATVALPIPSLPEQNAIATILSDMDAEITALEAKLAKARQIKQGMMQELLTGKTRLV